MIYVTLEKTQVYRYPLGIGKRDVIFAGRQVNVVTSKLNYDYIDWPIKGWVWSALLGKYTGTVEPPIPSDQIVRTLHPYNATHNGLFWPARTNLDVVPPATNSFDVNSRMNVLANPHTPGNQVRLTQQQWGAVLWKNRSCPGFEKWAVGGTDKTMMWRDNWVYPVFHFPVLLGGNFVKVISHNSGMTEIATVHEGQYITDEMLNDPTCWMRCWSIYSGNPKVRDAPAGSYHLAAEVYIPLLAQNPSMWVYDAGLL